MATKVADGARAPRKTVRKRTTTPDPIEIAMVAAGSGKPLPDAALNVLEKHAQLIDCQADLARAQTTELRLRKIGEGVRAALWAILAIAALAIVALIAAILIRAARSDALIVQSFRVPPALAAQGLTGEVVATQVLDNLAEMQARTTSVRAASTYANNWEDELKIDIPNTGATTSEIWKLLRAWLGKETRISGEIIRTPTGLALTARVGSKPGQRFESATGDLDALVTKGAELIYRHTQPYRFAVYLPRVGREAEMFPVLRALSGDPSVMERKWAYSGLSFGLNGMGRFRESIAMAERALALDPEMAPAMSNGAYAHEQLGHDQKVLDMSKSPYLLSSEEYDPAIAAQNRCHQHLRLGELGRDPAQFDRAVACYSALPGDRADNLAAARARAGLLRHDPTLARSYRVAPDGFTEQEMARFNAHVQLVAELGGDDPVRLSRALNAMRTAKTRPTTGRMARFMKAAEPAQEWPSEVEALIILGQVPEAAALVAKTPRDCYECVRMRGVVANAQGDPLAAQRWFGEAVRQGPRLSSAYVDWGRLLTKHRHFRGAEIRFAKAAELSPNWADPHKHWGDMLAAQGKRAEAVAKYDAALALAPKWAALRQARARIAR